MKRNSQGVRRVLVVIASVTSLQLFLSPPAFAWEAALGECSDGDSEADFSTIYTASGGNNTVNWFEVILSNPNGLGNKSNVNIQHYRNVSFGGDELLFEYTSGDDVPPHVLIRIPAESGLTTPDGDAHTRFEFAFDNALDDDHCNADTEDF